MEDQLNNRFERGILKVIALIGLVRFCLALLVWNSAKDGLNDLYLDLITAFVFLLGLVLVHLKASDKLIVGLFFVPLIVLLWVSFYVQQGLAGASEINAFAIIIILSLTIQGKMPRVFIGVFLLGVFAVLYFVQQQYPLGQGHYDTNTTTLLIVTLANLFMVYHAKNVFDGSRLALNNTNRQLEETAEEIQAKKVELSKQNAALNLLKTELEDKVLERTDKLQKQKDAIEAYLQLTLTELIKPYDKTLRAIKELGNEANDPMVAMVKKSGRRMEEEVEKLRRKLLKSNEPDV